MRYSKNALDRIFFVILAVLCWSGCATTGDLSRSQPIVVADGKAVLFVALPTIPDSVDSSLAGLGWGQGRLARELRKEIIYQFNRKGVAATEDSTASKASLVVNIAEYLEGGGDPSRYAGEALLRTVSGERRIAFGKTPKRAQGVERSDPTVDNIRLITSAIVEEACKAPGQKSNRKKDRTTDFNTPIMMVF